MMVTMTKEQIALDTLSSLAGKSDRVKQCRKILQPVINRNKPKEPVLISDDSYNNGHVSCPNCRKLIINVWSTATYMPRYCHYCGQALDWGKDNEEC